MIKRLSVICLTVALASTAHAGLRIASSNAALAPGTTSAVFNVQYFNDTGVDAAFIGAQTLDFSLATTSFAGSMGTVTLNSMVPTPQSGFVNFAPGFIGASSFTGAPVAAGNAVTIGQISVAIDPGFLGQFVLVNDSVIDFTVNDPALGTAGAGVLGSTFPGTEDSIAIGGIGGTTLGQVGTAVPEPSSFLFLGLVGTGMLGMRRMRQRREDEELEEAA